MTRKIYPLLVALDLYDPSSRVPSLRGCVTDIESIELYLRSQVADGDWELVEPRVLKNEQATREGVITGFQEFLCQATENDVALFYYAGHGAQERAPKVFLPLEPDGMNETLVCYDSRTTTGRDLADKELRYLINQVAKRNPHILVLMDCCHSGGGTREVAEGTRQGPADDRVRPLESYLFAQDQAFLQGLDGAGASLSEGRHVVLSACRDYQLAKECRGADGKAHGAFSYYLLETLQRAHGKMTYRELIRNLNALVSSKQRDQSPLIYATHGEDLSLSFLGGAASSEVSDAFALTYSDRDSTWFIDGGAVHGVPKPAGEQTTMLAVMSVDVPAEEARSLSHAMARVKVSRVMGNRSQVAVTEGENQLDKGASYRAIVTSTPLRPLMVFFKGEEAGVELIRSTFATAGPEGQPSLQLKEADQAFGADITLLCRDGQFWFVNPVDDLPLVGPVPSVAQDSSYTQRAAEQAIARLEHMARWQTVLDLASPARSQIQPDDLSLTILKYSLDGALQEPLETGSGEVLLSYELDGGEWVSPDILLRLTNNSGGTLYCDVLTLSSDYSIDRSFFQQHREGDRSIRLEPGQTVEEDITLGIDDAMLAAGITVTRDVFKVIISTTDFDASLMVQEGLDAPPPSTRDVPGEAGTLELLMGGVGTRKVMPSKRRADDWITLQVAAEVVRPQESLAIGDGRTVELLEDQVTVQPHGRLRAEASLTSAAVVSRDVDAGATMPAILRTDQSVTGAFQFSNTRGSDPGLSVLEISSCPNPETVTAEDPLKLTVNAQLADNEKVLALGKEGDFFVPVGYGKCSEDGECTEISIDKLPEPQINSRSLTGSMKIFFQKLVSDRLVGSFDAYPQLAAVTPGTDPDSKPVYHIDVPHVKAQVAAADTIVMYIHGIVGDTASMVTSIWDVGLVGDGGYDLVLAFDYENLNTPIEDNGKKLRERLEAVGLGAGHGKNFHIIAHSMGGLVSRWFIEQEGGKDMVQHLSMFGTPNGGSPWSAVQDWAFTSLTFGLNSLSTMFWPAGTVAKLLDTFDNSVISLDQMNVQSDFIAAIGKNPDPGVPYTIIAGDRSLSPQAKDANGELSPKLMGTLTKFLGKTIDTVVDTVFVKQPNDIAVPLESIKRVDSSRSPQPKVLPDPACDHLTYFASVPGLGCLKAAQTAALEASGVKKSHKPADRLSSQGNTSRGIADTPQVAPSESTESTDDAESSPGGMIFLGLMGAVTVGIVIAVMIGLIQRSPEPAPGDSPPQESSQLLPPSS
ncbi:MAG: caspase family protein [Cyanophyceae cyanobacterium]